MTKIYNQYISLNNILLNQRLWLCNCLYWRWQWSPDREEVRSPDAFHLELLRFMVGADVRWWERKISVWLSCWHLTPSTRSPSWRVTRGHIRGRAETPRGRRVEPTTLWWRWRRNRGLITMFYFHIISLFLILLLNHRDDLPLISTNTSS